MADREVGRRIPFGFLQAVQEAFMQKYTKEQLEGKLWIRLQRWGHLRSEMLFIESVFQLFHLKNPVFGRTIMASESSPYDKEWISWLFS